MKRPCLVVTYNCAKALQTTAVVKSILKTPLRNNVSPQFIVFFLQEFAPILDASMGWTDIWLAPFEKAVPPNYNLVGKAVSGAVAVLAFSILDASSLSIRYDTLAFGLLWSSLKGAALLTIKLPSDEGKLTFVGAHLAANEGYKEERNRDFNYVVDHFGLRRLGGQVFIGGDLNYRTTDGTIETDELSLDMKNGRVAIGFSEAVVEFGPTFKFYPSTLTYNPKRVSSYCDRILFRDLEGIEIQNYDAVMLEEIPSDHKPVYLLLASPSRGLIPMHSMPPAHDDNDPSSVNSLLPEAPADDDVDEGSDVEPENHHIKRRSGSISTGINLTTIVDLVIGVGAYSFTTRVGRLSVFAIGIGLAVLAFIVL